MSNGSASAAGSTRPPPSPLKNQPRQTQRYAAERLLDTLRKHTALVPPRDQHVHSVDEVLTLGASAVFGLTEEVQAQQREVERLQGELAAAYRASAIAAADDIGAARRQAEDTEQRAAHAAQQAVAREAELEAVVLSTHGQLAEEQRARAATQRQLEQKSASATLIEQKLDAVHAATLQLLTALPPSASEEAAEADRVRRVAAGESLPSEWDGADVLELLVRVLERAQRCTEQTRSSEAEVALLRAELEAERLAHSKLQDQLMYMTDERASLRREMADALAAKEISEKASQRFQALLHQQQRELEAHHELLQRQQQQQQTMLGLSPDGGDVARGAGADTRRDSGGSVQPLLSANRGAAGSPLGLMPSLATSPLRSRSPCSLAGSVAGSIAGSAALPPPPPPYISDSSVAAAAAAVDGLEAAVRQAASMTALLKSNH